MAELTKQGYDMIIERIINRRIKPPDMFDLDALTAWLNGYAKCQNDILDIIEKLRDSNGR